MATALVISPHADDGAIFCGGTLAKRIAEGWEVVLVRVTDDSKDAVSGTQEETLARNRRELHDAARVLGVSVVEDLGFETDCLCDGDRLRLRERLVYLYRKYRPHTVFTFDPFARHEENRDHVVCAQAAQEAFWVACFHLHHPEHLAAGLKPYSVGERWYFSRENEDANHNEDISEFLQQKIEAVCAHDTMIRNILNQMRLQLAGLGRQSSVLDAAIENDPTELIATMLTARSAQAETPGIYGEAFRVERLGALEPFLMSISEALQEG